MTWATENKSVEKKKEEATACEWMKESLVGV